MKKISITDIANRLGVSKTTVSFVLNNKGDEKNISKQTQEKVQALVKELNYTPSQVAKSLKIGSTKTIGYLIPDISNLFYARIGRKIEDYLAKEGYHLFIASTDENWQKEKEQINSFIGRQVDGLILASSKVNSNTVKGLIQRNFPLVLFDRASEEVDANYILVENEKSMQQAVEELIKEGANKIGLLSITPNVFSLNLRIKGYKNALKNKQLSVNKELIRTVELENIKESVYKELKALVDMNVDAVVFTNNLVAQEAIWHMNVHFKDLIDKLKFASFDNIEIFDYSKPSVLSLAQPTDKIAEKIVQVLISQIKGKKPTKNKTVVLAPKLIKRK
jgi:LacI family transcriptional regulator